MQAAFAQHVATRKAFMAKKIRAVIRIMWVFMALALVTLACVSITFVLRCIYYVLPFTPGFLYFQEFGTGVIIPMSFVGASFFGGTRALPLGRSLIGKNRPKQSIW